MASATTPPPAGNPEDWDTVRVGLRLLQVFVLACPVACSVACVISRESPVIFYEYAGSTVLRGGAVLMTALATGYLVGLACCCTASRGSLIRLLAQLAFGSALAGLVLMAGLYLLFEHPRALLPRLGAIVNFHRFLGQWMSLMTILWGGSIFCLACVSGRFDNLAKGSLVWVILMSAAPWIPIGHHPADRAALLVYCSAIFLLAPVVHIGVITRLAAVEGTLRR